MTKQEFLANLHNRCTDLRSARSMMGWTRWEDDNPGVQSSQVLALAELVYDILDAKGQMASIVGPGNKE